jgi:hypothetical protein
MSKILFSLIFCIFGFGISQNSFCQTDQKKLDDLKKKYPWGSIYVTYISFINLNSILGDVTRSRELAKLYPNSTLNSLQNFVGRYRGKDAAESIAFIEIDLNRVEAGYKRADDPGGEISPIAWDKADLINIADLCDKHSAAMNNYKYVLNVIKSDTADLSGVLAKVGEIKNNILISSEAHFVAAKEFRTTLAKKDDAEISKLSSAAQQALTSFKKEFDDKYFMINDLDQWAKLEDFEKQFNPNKLKLQNNKEKLN